MENLENKTILITGGSKGIGYGIAEVLLRQNARVAITSRTKASADEAAKSLNNMGGEIMSIEADVRDGASQKAAVEKVIQRWGTLDVLVANAGLGYFDNIENLTE
jgi:3-oxoacyl-[acyl-carrier protein] reductase